MPATSAQAQARTQAQTRANTRARGRTRRIAIAAAAAAALTVGCAVAGGPAGARSLGPPSTSSARPSAAGAGTAVPAHAVTLITGDRVLPAGPAGDPGAGASYAVVRARTSGPGAALQELRAGGHTYVIPLVARPYLGRTLDRSLFDVTTLSSAQGGAGRLAVRIAHTGPRPALPGVTIISDQAGLASGYLTAGSAGAFGRALVDQWVADQRAGHPSDTGLFAGISRIAAADVAPPVATPAFPMHTLRIQGVDRDGRPLDTVGFLMNADNGLKYVGFVELVGGEARVSVPTGTYTAVFDSPTFDETTQTSADAILPVTSYVVRGDGQTLHLDARRATTTARITVPRPLTSSIKSLVYNRIAQSGSGEFSSTFFGYDGYRIAPTPPANRGTQEIQQALTGTGGLGSAAYSYDVMFSHDSVGSALVDRASAANLATVRAEYAADQAGRLGEFGRGAMSTDGSFFIAFTEIDLPTRRTEYVGGSAGLAWAELTLANAESFEDPGFVDGGPYAYPFGSNISHTWLRGPLAPQVPTQTAQNVFPYCYTCLSPTAMTVGTTAFTDSMPDHSGELFADPSGAPVTHFRLQRNGTTLFDRDDYFGATVPVPSGTARYLTVTDIDRRLSQVHTSTASHTELGFTATTGRGPVAPSSWLCPASDGGSPCTVLPVVQARLDLPLSGTTSTPAGQVPVTVQVSRAPGAATSAARSATLEIRRTGTSAWTSVPLHTAANSNAFAGTMSVPVGWVGHTVDTRVTAADAGGSTFDQTISAAFAVDAAGAAGATGGAAAADLPGNGSALRPSCAAAGASQFRCLSWWRSGSNGDRALAQRSAAVQPPATGYGPVDIASAYRLDQSAGAGHTVAIVDAFDNPRAEADLASARSAWGLPPCTTANGCFRKLNQRGGTAAPEPDAGWGVEIALDLQAASYACPRCKLLLVEADTPNFTDIGAAVNQAVRQGVDVVSNSYGADEFTGMIALGRQYYRHPGTAIVASSGDFGFTAAQFPAVLGTTIAVGGTTLVRHGTRWSEDAWAGAGSGCSAWVAKPSWQTDRHCPMRVTADVSAVADPDTGLAVYDTYGLGPDNGWIVVGGTSASAPLISAMIALAGNGPALRDASRLYAHRTGLTDVVGGSNGFCGGDYLCTAVRGYDGPTGLGSPRGTSAL